MKHRFRCAWLLLLACLLPAAAIAERSATSFEPLGDTPVLDVRIGVPPSASGGCLLGETRPVAGFVNGYLFPPDDRYLTLLRPSGCTACPPPSAIQLTTAHVILGFNSPCAIPVDVSIVGSFPGECPVPDQANVICPPTRYILSSDEGGVAIDFGLALPPGCCISENAFLLITFVDIGTCADDPPVIGAAATPCNTCFSYNDNPTYGFVDICTDPFWPSETLGNPTMYAEADCCAATPVDSGTWGRVKAMYR